jgi:hypothetical protein
MISPVPIGAVFPPFARRMVHKVRMAKAKVTFKTVRIADDNWTIQADYPGSEQREITGLTSKADADDWMNGNRKIAWLRSQGYAK